MKFKFVAKVDHDLLCNLRKALHCKMKELGITGVPYTYNDGFYVNEDLTKNDIDALLIATKGWLVPDNNFIFKTA